MVAILFGFPMVLEKMAAILFQFLIVLGKMAAILFKMEHQTEGYHWNSECFRYYSPQCVGRGRGRKEATIGILNAFGITAPNV